MMFYLGTHLDAWLRRVDVPLFVSHRTLRKRRTLPTAVGVWALDSGAFSDIALGGEFSDTPAAYAAAVRRYRDEVGGLVWAAPQDHMCEPHVLARSKIADTVDAAQKWTVANYLDLRDLAADLPFIPVVQGQTLADYRRHVEAYDRAGVDLTAEALVGIGSVCRRQATSEIAELVAALNGDGLRLHGFGVKTSGLARYGWCLTSADSMAWSYRGRRAGDCPHGNKNCANCLPYALAWRERVVGGEMTRPVQLALDNLGGVTVSTVPAAHRAECPYCHEPVDTRPGYGAFRGVVGWAPVRAAGGANSIRAGQWSDRYAHRWCIDLAAKAGPFEQLTLDGTRDA